MMRAGRRDVILGMTKGNDGRASVDEKGMILEIFIDGVLVSRGHPDVLRCCLRVRGRRGGLRVY